MTSPSPSKIIALSQKEILGIKVHNLTKSEFLDQVNYLIQEKKQSYVVTPYSEFLVTVQKDPLFRETINSADLSIADGVGIPLALKYLKAKGIYFPLIKCLFALVFNRNYFDDEIKEKLSGSEAIYYLSEFASKKGYSLFLLGGLDMGNGNTGELAAKKLKALYPSLKILGTYSGSPALAEEATIISRINRASPDLLYIAYGPVAQEKWIFRNKNKLVPCVSFCLGGSFDFVSGEKRKVPKLLSDHGLEGVLRPFISERGNPKLIYRRIKRAWVGIINYIFLLIKEKRKLRDSNE